MNETRRPAETGSPRMEALARLPVFFALGGKRVVIAGGRPAAAWKVELLSAAGAHVVKFLTSRPILLRSKIRLQHRNQPIEAADMTKLGGQAVTPPVKQE